MSQTLNARPALIATPESSPKYDDSYMGYSVTVGDFAGNGIQSVAVGVPRGSDLRGLVSNFIVHLEYFSLYGTFIISSHKLTIISQKIFCNTYKLITFSCNR